MNSLLVKKLYLIAIAGFLAATSVAFAEEKAKPVDWGAIFKIHWKDRVGAFKDQNMAWANVVLLGDSITEGFDVARFFPGRRVLNRGIGGDVVGNGLAPDDQRGVLQRLDSSVFDCAPTDLFILIGINDFNSGHSIDSLEAGYREMLEKVRKHSPTLRVYVQSLLPTRGPHDDKNEIVREFNTRLQKMAGEFNCTYVDLHSLMSDGEGKLKAEFTPDGLHLKDPGYAVWRDQIVKTLHWE